MTLREVLMAQGNLKAQGMAQSQCPGLFASPALVRTLLADLLAHAQTFTFMLAERVVPLKHGNVC